MSWCKSYAESATYSERRSNATTSLWQPPSFSTFRKCCRIHLIFLKSIPYSFLSPSYPLVFPNILPKIGVNFGSTHLIIFRSIEYIFALIFVKQVEFKQMIWPIISLSFFPKRVSVFHRINL